MDYHAICVCHAGNSTKPGLSDIESALQKFVASRPSSRPLTSSQASSERNWSSGAAVPLKTSQTTKKCPVELDPVVYNRVSAVCKGFLIRRLLRTERVQAIIKSIRDTEAEAIKLIQDNSDLESEPSATSGDYDLGQLMLRQLRADRNRLHRVMIETSSSERNKLIRHDREMVRARLRNEEEAKRRRTRTPSAATRKTPSSLHKSPRLRPNSRPGLTKTATKNKMF